MAVVKGLDNNVETIVTPEILKDSGNVTISMSFSPFTGTGQTGFFSFAMKYLKNYP